MKDATDPDSVAVGISMLFGMFGVLRRQRLDGETVTLFELDTAARKVGAILKEIAAEEVHDLLCRDFNHQPFPKPKG